MMHLINETSRGPILRIVLPTILVAMALAGSISEPAAAAQPDPHEEIRLAVTDLELQDPGSLTRIRRRIAIAARALCNTGGVAALHGNGVQRCREQVTADAERQIEDRISDLRDSNRQGALAAHSLTASRERLEAPAPGSLLPPGRPLGDGQGQPALPMAMAVAVGLVGLSYTMAHATR